MTDYGDTEDVETGKWVNIFLEDEVVQRIGEMQRESIQTHTEMHHLGDIASIQMDMRDLDSYQVHIAALNTKLNDLEQERIGIALQLGQAMIESLLEEGANNT